MLRSARASDIPAIQRVRASVKENRLVSTGITDEDVRTAIEETGRGWVVEKDGEVVAFAIGNVITGNIWALFVHPRVRGPRLWSATPRHAGRLALGRWSDRLWLTTESGTRAQRFYEAAGWQLAGPTDRGEQRYELPIRLETARVGIIRATLRFHAPVEGSEPMHMRLCYLGLALLMTASLAACNRQPSQTAEAPASTTTRALELSGLADRTLPRR